MNDFRKEIIISKPEYLNRTLLLATKDLDGLFRQTGDSALVALKFDRKGNPTVSEYRNNALAKAHMSFTDMSKSCLQSRRISFRNLFKRLVTPEMEVERIFNAVRYKYLTAIHLSKVADPNEFITSNHNRAFQAMAGLQVYQGGTKRRKSNNAFWREAGFVKEATSLNWEKERDELQAILSLLKVINRTTVARCYSELIAIKPGFHELYIHDDYFDDDSVPEPTSPRNIVFRKLRNKRGNKVFELNEFPKEISKNCYFSYAPCNVTEGPFVFRKNIGVSYYDAIREIRCKGAKRNLCKSFHILDYYNQDLSTHRKLGHLLETAKRFCNFII